jgi:glucose 1-dehydrogenase
VVTGGDTGIGKAIVLAFAREGASVVVDYLGDDALARALVAQIEGFGGRAHAVDADVTQPADVETLIGVGFEQYGRLDIVVNNAGIEQKFPFVEMPLDVYLKTIAVNLTGAWLVTQAAVKRLIAQKQGGRVINISSIHEDVAMPTNAAYCASKGALRMLARTLSVELAADNITVNNICPGAIDTSMDKGIKRDPKELEALLDEIPLRRMGRPDEVAQVAVYLASDEAAYVTGASFYIDGGMSRKSGPL